MILAISFQPPQRRGDGKIQDPIEKLDAPPQAQGRSLLPFLVLEPGGGVYIS